MTLGILFTATLHNDVCQMGRRLKRYAKELHWREVLQLRHSIRLNLAKCMRDQ